ncbi:hypothetical protein ACFO9Q_03610 [Paenibacillus sp. GCM10023252]|uniref:hypothetical protein n=1 Tax=Paenibacillus sp. GCM10023252 TaxID=3252649 RepID=UPI0036080259
MAAIRQAAAVVMLLLTSEAWETEQRLSMELARVAATAAAGSSSPGTLQATAIR